LLGGAHGSARQPLGRAARMATMDKLSAARVERAQAELAALESAAVDELAVHIGEAAAAAKVREAMADPAAAEGRLLRQRAERARHLRGMIVTERDASSRRAATMAAAFDASLQNIAAVVRHDAPLMARHSGVLSAAIGGAVAANQWTLMHAPPHSVVRWRGEARAARLVCGAEAPGDGDDGDLSFACPAGMGPGSSEEGHVPRSVRGTTAELLPRGTSDVLCVAVDSPTSFVYGTSDGQVWRAAADGCALGLGRVTVSPADGGERTAPSHGGAVVALALLHDGSVASGCDEGRVLLHGRGAAAPRLVQSRPSAVRALATLADGSLAVACGGARPGVSIVDPASGADVCELRGHASAVTAILPLPGAALMTATADGVVRFFEGGEEDGAEAVRHETILVGLASLGQGRVVVASAGDDIRVIGPRCEEPARAETLPAWGGDDGRSVAETSAAGASAAGPVTAAPPSEPAFGASEAAGSLADVDGDGSLAESEAGTYVAGAQGSLGLEALYPAAAGASEPAGPPPTAGVLCQTLFSRGALGVVGLPGGHVAVACADGSIAVLEGDGLTQVSSVPGGRGLVLAMAETTDGRLLAAYDDGSVVVWGFLAPEGGPAQLEAARAGWGFPRPGATPLALRLADVEPSPAAAAAAAPPLAGPALSE